MKIEYQSVTKIGKRSINQDSFGIIELPNNNWLGIICDGMGGHSYGDIASKTIVETFLSYSENREIKGNLVDHILEAKRLASKTLDNQKLLLSAGTMGSTMALAYIQEHEVTFAHIGDSRCYLYRPNHDAFIYISKDHKSKDGYITKGFISNHQEVAIPDIAVFEIEEGDKIFLCSDGVTNCINTSCLYDLLRHSNTSIDAIQAVDRLCKDSNDNYTAIVLDIKK